MCTGKFFQRLQGISYFHDTPLITILVYDSGMVSVNRPIEPAGRRRWTGVSLVSGLDWAVVAEVSRLIAGGPRTSGTEIEEATSTPADFAVRLAEEVLEKARLGGSGHTVLALEADANPMEVGLVVEAQFESGLSERVEVELIHLVSVVKCGDVLRWLVDPAAGDGDDLDSGERLAVQIEFATSIVIADSVPRDILRVALGLIKSLNPTAAILSLADIGTRNWVRGDMRTIWPARRVGRTMGWMLALSSSRSVVDPRHGVDTLVWRDPRPFHSGRLSEMIHEDLRPERVGRIARSRGLTQLATRSSSVGSWHSAGNNLSLQPTDLAAWSPDSPAGQELVFFGLGLNLDRISDALDACLLTGPELLAGPMGWSRYPDPFPVWPEAHHH